MPPHQGFGVFDGPAQREYGATMTKKRSSRHPQRKPSLAPSAKSSTTARGRSLITIAAIGVVVLLAAVFGVSMLRDDGSGNPTPTALAQAAPTTEAMPAGVQAIVPEAVGAPLTVLPTGSTYVVGAQRFGIGLVDEQDQPVQVGRLELVFLTLAGNQGSVTEVLPAPFLDYGLAEGHDHATGQGADPTATGPGLGAITGVFVARPTFAAPGSYGVIAKVTMPDGTVRAGQASFEVAADSPVPGIGEPAIASKSLTAITPEERENICSATPADDMHDLSIEQALANDRPTVVLFATPAYCATRTCGPSLEALTELKRRYGSGANFIHIEIYPGDDFTTAAPTIDEWGLPSEPWLFLIDADGKVVERYEGGIGLTELDPAVQALVGATPA